MKGEREWVRESLFECWGGDRGENVFDLLSFHDIGNLISAYELIDDNHTTIDIIE